MQSPSSSSSSSSSRAHSTYPQSAAAASLEYSPHHAMHHQSVFDHHHHHHHLAYAGLHHHAAAAAYPQLHPQLPPPPPHHHQGPSPAQSHYHPGGGHASHLKRDHEAASAAASMGGGSSDEEHLGDVKPPGLSSGASEAAGLRGGRGSGLKPPGDSLAGGKKTKGRVKIKMEFIDNKLRRYTTFSKRKTGIMKKAYELSTLTGTQVMLLVASETGHVYTFATRKLQPMITSDAGKALIQTCLNSPDPSPLGGHNGGDQRMSATGYEETELTYNVAADEESQKILDEDQNPRSGSDDDEDFDEEEYDMEEEATVASEIILPPPLKKRPPRPIPSPASHPKRSVIKQDTKSKGKRRAPVEEPSKKSNPVRLLRPSTSSTTSTHQPTNSRTNTSAPAGIDQDSNDGPLNMVTSYITSHPPHRSSSAVLKKEIVLRKTHPKKDSGGQRDLKKLDFPQLFEEP